MQVLHLTTPPQFTHRTYSTHTLYFALPQITHLFNAVLYISFQTPISLKPQNHLKVRSSKWARERFREEGDYNHSSHHPHHHHHGSHSADKIPVKSIKERINGMLDNNFEALRAIYRYYCAEDQSTETKKESCGLMSLSEFLSFIRDCRVPPDGGLTQVRLHIFKG